MIVGRVAGGTDTGRKRRRNEDAYVVQPPLFAVADGMGGPQAGEVASRLAAAALEESARAGGGEEQVAELIQEANRRVHRAAAEDSSRSGMGTTITVALVEDGTVAIGHVGDSRAYRLRDGQLDQLTEDHSLVAELMRSGKLSPEEARIHPQRSVITRALGTDPDVDVDLYTVEARTGDVFLLCSDGLFSMVEDEAIQETLERHLDDLDAAVKTLIRQALKGGGEDNITVLCFEIVEGEADTTRIDAGEMEERTRENVFEEPDDDTLDELDRVPAIDDTMLVRPEDLPAEAAPRRRRRERHERSVPIFPALLLVGIVIALIVFAVLSLVR